MNIIKYVNGFLKDRNHTDRYSSFDYCYNHFYSFYKNDKINELSNEKNIENSCYKLWFYLSSWWMMRWSSFLLSKSVAFFQDLIKEISNMPKEYWEIDIDNYTDENIENLLKIKKIIKRSLWISNNPSDTLITKIMLWVFWNIPAFDQYFKKWLNLWSVNKKNLKKIKQFYDENKDDLNSFSIKTLNFRNWENTEIFYTKAKILDMYWFWKWSEQS